MKPVYFNNVEFKEIMQKVKELVNQSEQLREGSLKDLNTSLLKYFDLMHREPLARIMECVEKSDPELSKTLKQDYTIHTLLELYDFDNSEIKRETSS